MTTTPDPRYRRALGWLLYLMALLLIAGPLSQWLVLVWPTHADVPQWRYGAIGLVEERLVLPMVGVFTAIIAATLLEQRAAQGVLAGLSLLAAPALAGLTVTIALDGLQLRNTVIAAQLRGFDLSLARTALVLLYGAVVAAVLGWVALKARGKKDSVASELRPQMTGGRFAAPGA